MGGVSKSNAEYWAERALADEAYFQDLSADFYKKLAQIHQKAHEDVKRELASVIRNMEKNGGGDNYLYRKRQLEALQARINETFATVGGQDVRLMSDFFRDVITESTGRGAFRIQQAAGLGFEVRKPNKQLLDSILNSEWAGRNFKQSVGWNMASVAEQAKEIVAKASITGVNIHGMTQELAALQSLKEADLWKAERLIRTETNYFAGQGELQSYARCEIDRYRYLATLDKVTSEACRDLDGKAFNVADAQPGKNYPPMHPWCRSTTVAHFDDEELDSMARRARDPVTGKNEIVEPGMTYREWEKKFLKEEPENGIMETQTPILTANEVISKAKTITDELTESPNTYSIDKGEVFGYILETQGFDGLPQVVSAEEFDSLAEGQRIIYRGMSSNDEMKASDMAEQFKSGTLRVNNGSDNNKHGRGVYGAFDEGRARTYAENDGTMIEMIMSEDARIADAQTIYKEMYDNIKAYWEEDCPIEHKIFSISSRGEPDLGSYAALKGYDAISTNGFRGDDYIVILNRTKAIIKE